MVDLRVNRCTFDEPEPEIDDILDKAPNLKQTMTSPPAVIPSAEDDYEPSLAAEDDIICSAPFRVSTPPSFPFL